MQTLYKKFTYFLNKGDGFGCLDLILNRFQNNELDIVTLYDKIIAPALREDFCQEKQKAICVWKEHIRTSIIRTVIECCYPYVFKERTYKYKSPSKGKVIVVCPPEELHEIGARMVADFFSLCGFDTTFIGANTPQVDIIEAIAYMKPKYIAISVSNCYNLLVTRRTIQKIQDLRDKANANFKIIGGGLAFTQNPRACDDIGFDLILNNFEDIKKLPKGNE